MHERFLDGVDAFNAGMKWLRSLKESRGVDHINANPCEKNGGVITAWSRSELIAVAVIVRDDRNHALLLKIDNLSSPPEACS